MGITIERLSGPTPDARALIAELDEVLGALYEPEQRHGLSIEQVFQPNVRFFMAHIGDAAVGCGALALFDDYAEVKRMYTREAARGRGIGKALLAHLAKACVDNGWARLQWAVLDWNEPSIAFYKSLGAVMMDEWTLCRVSGPALDALARQEP